MPIGRLDPLVARLIGATTATRVGDGADWRFLGGRAGGLETEKKEKKKKTILINFYHHLHVKI